MGVCTDVGDVNVLYRTVVWQALAKLADKESSRDVLPDGAAYVVEGVFSGEVDGQAVSLDVEGKLCVGHESVQASSIAPCAAHVLALALEQIPKTRRGQILDILPKQFSELGELPPVSHDLVDSAEALLTSLRSRKTVTRRGTVHFSRAA